MFHLRRLANVLSIRGDQQVKLITHPANLKSLLSLQPRNLSSTQSQTSNQSNLPLILTDSCIKRLKELKGANSKKRLRVLVDSGGCSGFEYKFSLDTEVKPDDIVVERDGCEILIDQASEPYLKGATVDYYEELIRTGFRVINNPNSEQGCSCGTSFSIKIN